MKKLFFIFFTFSTVCSYATDYTMRAGTIDANGKYSSSIASNWSTDGGATGLASVPTTTALDNLVIPVGVNVDWGSNKTIGILTVNGGLYFGTAGGATAFNFTLNISSLIGDGTVATSTQTFGLRFAVTDAAYGFTGTITSNVLGFTATSSSVIGGSIKLTQDAVIAAGPSFANGSTASLAAGAATNYISGNTLTVSVANTGIVVGTMIYPSATTIPLFVTNVVSTTSFTLNAAASVTTGTITYTNNYIDLNGYQLTINGSLNNPTSGGFFKTSAGSKLILGSAAVNGIYNFLGTNINTISSGATVGFTIKASGLTIDNGLNLTSGTVTVNTGAFVTLGNAATARFEPASSLIISANATVDFAGKSVTLQSSSSGTARIGVVSGTLNNATNVTVERYIPASGRKSYTMVTAPVSSPTIYSAWQEGGAITTGYGTQITGAASGNGFDAASASGFPSVFTYDDNKATGTKWVGLTNTNVNTLAAGKGYLLYVRGDRTILAGSPLVGNTILRATGAITTGDVILSASLIAGAGKFNLIANPYPSAIMWANNSSVVKTNVTSSFYVYDPNLGVFVTSNGTIVSPSGSQQRKDTIQSGQAFFIQNDASGLSPTITFKETAKVGTGLTGTSNTVFTNPSEMAQLNVNIYSKNTGVFADGVVALFSEKFKSTLAEEDAAKLGNFNETLSLIRNHQRLSIEGRPMPIGKDTLHVGLDNFSNKEYTMKIDTRNFSVGEAILIDNYSGKKVKLDLSGINSYDFLVDSDPVSYALDRFIITLENAFKAISVDAADKNFLVHLSPNPVKDQLHVTFKTAEAENTSIKIISSLGQVVREVNAGKVSEGDMNIDTKGLSAGAYTVQLLYGRNLASTRKIIKQ